MANHPIERISDLKLFARIAANGSLTAAARELGMSLANVSTRLSNFERSLGVRLIHRSTRRLHLSAEGEAFLARLMPVLSEIEQLEDAVAGGFGEVRGRLRLTSSSAFARRHIAPLIPAMNSLHPDVVVELLATDETLDLIAEGIDLAIRQSPLPDSSLVVRHLIPNDRVACASPQYLDWVGRPETPHRLPEFDCIAIGNPPQVVWPFVGPEGENVEITVDPGFQVNHGDVAHEAMLAGAGIALKSRIDVIEDIEAGSLVDIFPDWSSPGSPIQAVFPSSAQVPEKVRVFLDLLTQSLRAKLYPQDRVGEASDDG